ncbi:hypothetical protein BOX15_Mlig027754g1, partial [Macrostomum lignano]
STKRHLFISTESHSTGSMAYQYPFNSCPSASGHGNSNTDSASSSNCTEEFTVQQQQRASKKYWAPQQTDALLKLIEEYREPLRNSRVQKQVWSEIAQRLNSQLNFAASSGSSYVCQFTGPNCSTKWRNLKRDLRLAIETGCIVDGRFGCRNPELMSAVAKLDSVLSNSSQSDTNNRRHSMADFHSFGQQQRQQDDEDEGDEDEDYDEGPYDLSMAKRPQTPPVVPVPVRPVPMLPRQVLHERSGSISSSSSSFAVRRHRSVPTLTEAAGSSQPSQPTQANNSLDFLTSLLASSSDSNDASSGQLFGDLVVASSDCADPLGEARRRLQLMRRSELHSHLNRIGQLDRLISVIDAAIEAGAGGGSNAGGNTGRV